MVLSKRVNPHPNEECDEHPFMSTWDEKTKMNNLDNQVRCPMKNSMCSSGTNRTTYCNYTKEPA